MAKVINLIGQKFYRLTVIERAPNRGTKITWLCKCDCGKESIAQSYDLQAGKHRSCGCLQMEAVTKHHATKFGGWRTDEYRSWMSMKYRCLNPKSHKYHRYGGRGISICDQWIHSFENFLLDMGQRTTPKHTLERIDNNGNYEPTNCRWATHKEQAQNRSCKNNHFLTYDGITLSVSQWAKRLNIKPSTLSARLQRGASDEEALVTPLRKSITASILN